MKAEDLMIGNLVDLYGTVATIQRDDFSGKGIAIDKSKPISLTEEWLLKLGFCKGFGLIKSYVILLNEVASPFNKESILFNELIISFCNDKGKEEYYVFKKQGNRNRIKDDSMVSLTRDMRYVHELQNLWKALTKTELEIK